MTQPAGLPHDGEQTMTTVEIERRYLLKEMPALPPNAERWSVEQGYFANHSSACGDGDAHPIGRIRRASKDDGTVVCTHTIKRGAGLTRLEDERVITIGEFERLWSMTEGQRLRKVRHCVQDHKHLWEIDQFEGIDLVLAEVELRTPTAAVQVPDWLQPCIEKEVTDDPAYTNASIALRISGCET